MPDSLRMDGVLPFIMTASLGQVAGVGGMSKYGSNVGALIGDANPHDIWTKSFDLTLASAPEEMWIASDDNSDTIAINVAGLGEDKLPYTEDVVLAGQTPVKLPGKPYRIFRIKNKNGTVFAGDLHVAATGIDWTSGVPDNDADVRAHCLASEQQTLMTQFTIPKDYYGALHSIFAGIRANAASVTVRSVDISLKAKGPEGVWLTKSYIPVVSSGTSTVNRPLCCPKVFSPLTDLKFIGSNAVGTSILLVVEYDIQLIHKDVIGDDITSLFPG